MMKRIKLAMVRKDMVDIPQYSLPDGFRLRLFEKGDEQNWARIETSVGEFIDEKVALSRFENEFGTHIDDMTERCLFIEDEHGKVIATTTAWYGNLEGYGERLGRIH